MVDIPASEWNKISKNSSTIIPFTFKEWNPYQHGDSPSPLKATLSPPEIGLQSNIINNEGNVLLRLKQEKDAIATIRISQRHSQPYNGLGNVLNNIRKYEQAIEAFQSAVFLNPKDPKPYYGLGLAFIGLNENKKAMKAFKTFIKLWKGDRTFRKSAKEIIQELQKR
jgi:tetratricopeptide (TPR) repeat protein